MREVKEANPEMGIEGCNSGGEWANLGQDRAAWKNNQCSDGGGPDDSYYLSYFWPVAKMITGGASSTRLDEVAQERLRQDTLFHRFLRQQGVLDRYMRVYHPRAEGAPTPHTYLQLTQWRPDQGRHPPGQSPEGRSGRVSEGPGAPGRLQRDVPYGKDSHVAKGDELMKSGIRFTTTARRETVLLNLDRAPGRGTDKSPPTAPGQGSKRVETWAARAGVAVRWAPSQDDGLIAEYEIMKDGNPWTA